MNAELASILIPVFNEEKHLAECLESILSQNFESWEVILVDDGSTDNTFALAQEFQKSDPRIRILRQKHAGVIEALNKGLKFARGKFLVRIDADDLMAPGRLSSQIALLQKLGPGNLVTGLVKYFPESVVSPAYRSYEDWLNNMHRPEDFSLTMLVECPVAAPAFSMFLDDALNLEGFAPGIYPEDYHFILKCHAAGIRFHSTGKESLLWRMHSVRSSLNSSKYSRDNFRKVKERFLIPILREYCSDRECCILGTGKNGKWLQSSLNGKVFPLTAFVSIHPHKVGKHFCGLPCHDPSWLKKHPDTYCLVAVNSLLHGENIRKEMQKLERIEGKDWLFCA